MAQIRSGLFVVALLFVAACAGDAPTGNTGETSIAKTAGDVQEGPAGSLLTAPVSVTVRNGSGAALPNVQVQFSVVLGGGATSDTVLTTNASGIAVTDWYLGSVANVSNTLRASIPNASVDFTAQSASNQAGATSYGDEQYIEYLPGDLPIIITAPHGGTLVPATIPDRTGTDVVTDRDLNTEELARTIRDVFFQRTGRRPHVIICRLRRTKLDANREIVEAALGNRVAQRAWFEFHHFTAAAKSTLNATYARGLYMDLHGHGHAIPRLELGYLLTANQLGFSDATLLSPTYSDLASIRSLVQSSGSTLPQLLRGAVSLGALFEQEGYPSVPSPSQPNPGVGNEYFNGGYNTARHGSRDGGTISGFQLEANRAGVRETPAERLAFANSLVDVFVEYLLRHYGIDIS